jgi:predicted porin
MRGLGTAAASAAVILLSGAGGAYAADLPTKAPAYKAPADDTCTSILDFFTTACQVAAYGVRFYGTIDTGLTYETHGAPMDKYLGVNSFLSKMSNGAKFLPAPNGLSASNIGFQIKEPLGAGWSFVGQVEAGFNPDSLYLLNGVHSVFNAIGTPLANQTAFGDSNSQGAFYNDLGFTGVSHDTWGTLTFFRQNDLMQDAILSYDPMGVSAAFSPLGFFGGFAGAGDTENRRDTTAIKYRVNLANWHFAAYGQVGGYNQGNAANGGAQGDVGADFHVGPGLLSFDTIGAWKKDAVSLGSGLAGPVDQQGQPIFINTGGLLLNPTAGCLGTGKGCTPINFESVSISNNTSVMATAKYEVNKLRLYAGYEYIHFGAPSDPQTAFTDIAGDLICAGCNVPVTGALFNGTTISNVALDGKVQQMLWVGAKYSLTDSLDVTAAYYHDWQNDFSGGAANKPLDPVTGLAVAGFTCAQSSTANASCAGHRDSVSAVLDWRFAPKWDTYIGVGYSHIAGGYANGFLQDDILQTTGGIRFRW